MPPLDYPSAWLRPCSAHFCFTCRSHCSCRAGPRKQRGHCLLPTKLPLPARIFQLTIARRILSSAASNECCPGCHRSQSWLATIHETPRPRRATFSQPCLRKSLEILGWPGASCLVLAEHVSNGSYQALKPGVPRLSDPLSSDPNRPPRT